jgi:polyhydroxyalkanoate synthesis regulator phasin
MSVVKDLLGRLFWTDEAPSAAAIADKLEELRAELGHAEEMRGFHVSERQRLLAVLSRDELRDADRLAADAQNDVDRLRAQIAVLEAEHAAAVEREALAELAERKKRLERQVKVDASKLLDEYDAARRAAAAALGPIAEKVSEIDREVAKLNEDLRTRGLPADVRGVSDTYRKHPDVHTPARTETRERWVRRNADGEVYELGLFHEHAGVSLPVSYDGKVYEDAYKETYQHVLKEAKTVRGEYLPPLSHWEIPPARVKA